MHVLGFEKISDHLFADETEVVRSLAEKARLSPVEANDVSLQARKMVEAIRKGRKQAGGIEEFMQEYALSSEEGIVLMCLAEALLRIPDAETADRLIADKIGGAEWQRHLGKSDSLFVNASTWGLMLTGKVLEADTTVSGEALQYLSRLVKRSGEPVIRQAMRHAMRIMGKQFVLGRTIEEALDIAEPPETGLRYSFDMLGEAARSMSDAKRYFASYEKAINTIGKSSPSGEGEPVFARPSISVKLSALHPRYEALKETRVMDELLSSVLELALKAKALDIGFTIDAEEADRLEISLKVFHALCTNEALAGWNGLGLAVQAYSKRALPVLEWLASVARQTDRRLPVRLVKGAYWDTEIKLAQIGGFEGYPVFTRKASTDVSYLACARYMLSMPQAFYPQFASHNAHTLACVNVMAGENTEFECQRLHGMGQALFDEVTKADGLNRPARIYAPVGSHEDLLAYLVRRLLENGANSSFVNRLADDEMPIETIIADPVLRIDNIKSLPHPNISLPSQIFSPRQNSAGFPVWDQRRQGEVLKDIHEQLSVKRTAVPIVGGKEIVGDGKPQSVTSPHDRSVDLGTIQNAAGEAVDKALSLASSAQPDWDLTGGSARGEILEKAADLYEENAPKLLGLLIREAGKTLANAQADLREAVDFLRYYASEARNGFSAPQILPGPTGERNEISLNGRGTFSCISPWNFPLAIFTGQVAASLAAGNAVCAKPAEQTPLIAFEAVRLLHRAGVPGDVLHYLPGDGAAVGARLVEDIRTSGIAFTGSNETASIINRTLADRQGPIVPFIAETGGINALVADSSALPEQVVRDAVISAFDSAGQRCSAARILFVQKDISKRLVGMLQGAVEELKIGDPLDPATDVGPVIDEEARGNLDGHKALMVETAKTLIDLPLPPETDAGTFVSPAVYQLDDAAQLTREVFGPILHVVEYSASHMDKVIEAINATGYGLTFGLHTRIERTAEKFAREVRAGNLYINRNQIGAVVGSQPFGGEGLSGTGPKAGGPNYLKRFATERVVSTDTTASGGNAALLSLEVGVD